MKFLNYFIVVFICFTLIACEINDKTTATYHVNMENGTVMMNEYTKAEGDAIAGKYFSRITPASPFGGGISIVISDSLILVRTKVVFEGKIRSSVLQTRGSIIVSLGKDDVPVSWNNFMAAGTIQNVGEWTLFKDSIEFPKRVNTKVYNKISVFGFLGNSNEIFDLDDLNITITYF